ncbi:MAG TPA: AsmA family protein [Gammaproteobacteria bacterium]|nr:AsmA family protein [Gammaproteobacteria bacterium]
MKKALKITGIVVGILVLLVILMAVALPFIFNPNSFKDDIARMVKQRTGRELVIQGDIKLSIFPWLGMQIGPMELSNAQGFGSVPFASINETDVHVAFWPLLHHEVKVGEVKLNGLNLDLEQDADGHNNWHDIRERLVHSSPQGGEEDAGRNVDLSVAGVDITDSQVRWTDAQKHQQYTISDFTLKLGAFASAKPLSVDSAFDFTGTNPAVQGHLDFTGTGMADLEHRLYSADEAKLEMQAQGDAVPGGQLKSTLRWQHLAYNAEQASLAVNGLDADAYGMSLHLEAQGKDIGKGASFSGSAKLARFSPRDVLKALGHPNLTDTRDATAFSSAAGSFGFVADGSSAAFSGLDFTLDDTHLTGDAALKDFKTRAMTFNLTVDKLDVDRYLPPQQLGTPDRPREEIDLDKVGVPLRTLRALSLDGHLHVGSFTLLGAKAGDLDVTVNSAGGLMTVKPLTANLYGGSLEADLTVDATDLDPVAEPKVSEDFTLKGVQAQALGQDLFKAAKLSGTFDLTGSVHGVGRLIGTLRRTVSGKVGFKIKSGAVEGVNVWDAIVREYARREGRAVPKAAAPRTEFNEMRGTASISRGMLSNRDFFASLPGLSLSGAGKLDLADLTLDYQLKGHVIGNAPGAAGLKGSVVPVYVSGTLGRISVQPDLTAVARPKASAAGAGE